MYVRTAIFFFVTLSATSGAFAQDPVAPNPAMDAIERQLEVRRHERLLARIAENDATMDDFTTDGCSGGLSAGWEQFSTRFPEFAVQYGEQPPWQECCVIHDQQYHAGGAGTLSASESFERRKEADLDLKACVVDSGVQGSADLQDADGLTEAEVKGRYKATSELMYRAVRLGGIPCTNRPWRWGYGWPRCR
jgi:hypothetical protein